MKLLYHRLAFLFIKYIAFCKSIFKFSNKQPPDSNFRRFFAGPVSVFDQNNFPACMHNTTRNRKDNSVENSRTEFCTGRRRDHSTAKLLNVHRRRFNSGHSSRVNKLQGNS